MIHEELMESLSKAEPERFVRTLGGWWVSFKDHKLLWSGSFLGLQLDTSLPVVRSAIEEAIEARGWDWSTGKDYAEGYTATISRMGNDPDRDEALAYVEKAESTAQALAYALVRAVDRAAEAHGA